MGGEEQAEGEGVAGQPVDEWEAYDSEPCDDPDNWQDEAEE